MSAKGCAVLLSLCLLVTMLLPLTAAAEGTTDNNRKLQNGSFEKDQTFTNDYSQPNQSAVPARNTPAFEGKIE